MWAKSIDTTTEDFGRRAAPGLDVPTNHLSTGHRSPLGTVAIDWEAPEFSGLLMNSAPLNSPL